MAIFIEEKLFSDRLKTCPTVKSRIRLRYNLPTCRVLTRSVSEGRNTVHGGPAKFGRIRLPAPRADDRNDTGYCLPAREGFPRRTESAKLEYEHAIGDRKDRDGKQRDRDRRSKSNNAAQDHQHAQDCDTTEKSQETADPPSTASASGRTKHRFSRSSMTSSLAGLRRRLEIGASRILRHAEKEEDKTG